MAAAQQHSSADSIQKRAAKGKIAIWLLNVLWFLPRPCLDRKINFQHRIFNKIVLFLAVALLRCVHFTGNGNFNIFISMLFSRRLFYSKFSEVIRTFFELYARACGAHSIELNSLQFETEWTMNRYTVPRQNTKYTVPINKPRCLCRAHACTHTTAEADIVFGGGFSSFLIYNFRFAVFVIRAPHVRQRCLPTVFIEIKCQSRKLQYFRLQCFQTNNQIDWNGRDTFCMPWKWKSFICVREASKNMFTKRYCRGGPRFLLFRDFHFLDVVYRGRKP